ncbi:Ig domain-containing protein [Deinococcus arcticus]|uniref:Cell ssuface protein containing Ig-like domain protein n=1 Tax=Deinococcus arcticus TaxID=2136176 RepID=A0A2T3W6G1_9DEIO|nr:Ig domain-containing protein [Deinococcus arcticus]PTA67478.1 cell ssuface protein containing Ig-like domain protein [Deinococcus arcticus]
MTPHRPLGRALLALLVAGTLASCGQSLTGTSATGGRDPLQFVESPAGLAPAYVNETYAAPLTVSGGAGPYTVRKVSGTLPPGLTLQGQQLSGKPEKTGTYTFTVEVTDSTLSTKSRTITLNVQDLPPLSLAPTLPAGQIRGETRIPLTITAPRSVRAARFAWDLPAGVIVTRVQPEGNNVLFWRQQGSRVVVDLGFKTVPRTGARVALLTVKPTGPVALAAPTLAYEARDGEGKLLSQKLFPDEQKKLDEQKAAEQKAAEQKAAEQKAAEQKAAEQKAAEQKAAPSAPGSTPAGTGTGTGTGTTGTGTPTTTPVTPLPAPGGGK